MRDGGKLEGKKLQKTNLPLFVLEQSLADSFNICLLFRYWYFMDTGKQNDDAARDLERFEVYSEGRGSAAFAEVISIVNAF